MMAQISYSVGRHTEQISRRRTQYIPSQMSQHEMTKLVLPTIQAHVYRHPLLAKLSRWHRDLALHRFR